MDPSQGLAGVGRALMALYGAGWRWRDPTPGPGGWTRSAVKTGATASPALAGAVAGRPGLAVLGVALGAAGNLRLSRPGARWFLAGMAAFATGHLAYAAHFASLAQGLPSWPVLLARAALGAATEVWLAPFTGALRGPVRAYVAVILVMAAAAAALPGGAWPVMAGAGLFLLSELMRAVGPLRLGDGRARMALRLALWPACRTGQALILLGLPAPGRARESRRAIRPFPRPAELTR